MVRMDKPFVASVDNASRRAGARSEQDGFRFPRPRPVISHSAPGTSTVARRPERTTPSNVPAPPMLAMPVPISAMSFRGNRSAPMSGPSTSAENAMGGAHPG